MNRNLCHFPHLFSVSNLNFNFHSFIPSRRREMKTKQKLMAFIKVFEIHFNYEIGILVIYMRIGIHQISCK